METSLIAPFAAASAQVLAGPNVHVAAHAPLLQLEPLDGDGRRRAARASASRSRRARRPARDAGALPREPRAARVRRARLRRRRRRGGAHHRRPARRRARTRCDPALVPGEHRLLAPLRRPPALTRPRGDDQEPTARLARSPQEHLHAFLRSLDAKAEGLPDGFVAQLRTALRHYGIESLDRTPGAGGGVLPALPRPAAGAAGAGRRARDPRPPARARTRSPGRAGPASARRSTGSPRRPDGRDPVVADLARAGALRVLRRARDRRRARRGLRGGGRRPRRARASDPERADRDARIAALVACPQPLAPMLARRMADAAPAAAARAAGGDGAPLLPRARARAVRRDDRRRPPAPHARATGTRGRRGTSRRPSWTWPSCPPPCAPSPTWAAALPAGELAVADFYVACRRRRRTGRARRADPARCSQASRCRRACIGSSSARRRPAPGGRCRPWTALTFRPATAAWSRTTVLRGLHPMMSHRLRLARLSRVRARPAARRRGRLPVPRRRAREPARTSGCSRSPRCAT